MDESEIALLRETLAYLQGRKAEPPKRPRAREDRADAVATAQRFIAEQRTIAEALLREVCALEQRLEIQAKAVRAASRFDSAQQKAHEATRLAQAASERADEATVHYHAAAIGRRNADELVAVSRADARTTADAVAELEQLLASARRMVAEVAAQLRQREAKAGECAAAETAAEAEATRASARAAEMQIARERALDEARVARDEAEALKKEAAAAAPTLAGVSDVQHLAKRIAEAAATLTAQSSAGWN